MRLSSGDLDACWAPAVLGAVGLAPESLSSASRRGCGKPAASGDLTGGVAAGFVDTGLSLAIFNSRLFSMQTAGQQSRAIGQNGQPCGRITTLMQPSSLSRKVL